jgi:hypothetical protein
LNEETAKSVRNTKQQQFFSFKQHLLFEFFSTIFNTSNASAKECWNVVRFNHPGVIGPGGSFSFSLAA